MLIGYGPLPRAGLPYLAAPSLRTRHFLKPILEAGHTVNLFTLPVTGSEGPEGTISAMRPDTYEGLGFQRFTNHSGEFAIRAITEQARQLQPDAIVGVNTFAAWVASQAATTVPVWADLNGYLMGEVQGQCAMDQQDERLLEFWRQERAILRRCDKFSAVSRPQLHAVLGEMGGLGRLNRLTFHYQLGHCIPNAACALSELIGAPEHGQAAGPVLRGPVVPTDAFIILWSGGFNIWADIPTMIAAMNKLMERYPTVHFVSTGGRVEGVVSNNYQIFEELVEQSPFKDRFHRLGWVGPERLSLIFKEANLGISVDQKCYETIFGARNRINTMAVEGLAVVSTIGTELTEWLEDGHALLAAPPGDPAALAEVIEPWIEQREGLERFAHNALAIMREDFSYEKTTRPLLNWLTQPRLAPDNRAKVERSEGKLTDLNAVTINSLEEEALLLDQHKPQELKQALAELESQGRPRRRFNFGFH